MSTIKLSHSKSGFNMYLPNEAVGPLPATTFAAEVRAYPEGGYYVLLIKDAGVNRFSKHTDPKRPHRITFHELRKTGLKRKEVEQFGVIEVDWAHVTNSADAVLRFDIPKPNVLPAPMRPKKRTKPGGPKALPRGLDLAPVEETPHGKLGRLLRELNGILLSGAVNDVEIRLETIDAESELQDPVVIAIGKQASLTQIKGKIVREEILG